MTAYVSTYVSTYIVRSLFSNEQRNYVSSYSGEDSRDAVNSDLVAQVPQLLDVAVVGELVGDEVGGVVWTPVGVLPFLLVEQLLVDVDVLRVDGVIEGDDHHLWYLECEHVLLLRFDFHFAMQILN